jgi:hypothetical protein
MAPSTCRPMLTRFGPTICFHCLSADKAGVDKQGAPDAEPVLFALIQPNKASDSGLVRPGIRFNL